MHVPMRKHVSQHTEVIMWIVVFYELVIFAKSQYSHVEAYRELQIGYPSTVHSKSREQLLVFTDMDLIYYMPKMKNCLEWAWFFRFPSSPSDLMDNEVHCIYLGLSRFWWHNKKRGKKRPFGFLQAKPRYMVTASKIGTSSEKQYSSYGMFYWNNSIKAPKVPWHYIAGTGPGWIDLRFAVPKAHPNGLYTYRIRHWRHSDGQDPQYAYETLVPNLFIDWKEIMPRVKPPLPCPQWKTYDIYCVLLTAHINPLHFTAKNFSDYVVQIFTIGLKPKIKYQVNNYTYNQIDTQLYGEQSDPYTFTVRVWENCDTTSEGCPKILRSLPFHKEWTKEPVVKEVWGPNKTDEDITTTATSTPLTEGGSATPYAYLLLDQEYKTLYQFIHLWPLMLFILLAILLIILPMIFFLNRRSIAQREMNKWFFWSREDDSIVYAVRRPQHLPPMNPEEPWIPLEEGATLHNSKKPQKRRSQRRSPRLRSDRRRNRSS